MPLDPDRDGTPGHGLRSDQVSGTAQNKLGLSDPPRHKVGDALQLSILK